MGRNAKGAIARAGIRTAVKGHSGPNAQVLGARQNPFYERLTGPGGLYNTGNMLALCSGLVFQLVDSGGQLGLVEAIRDHLIGSPGEVWLTGSMILFIVAGELYHRAWSGHHAPHARLTQLGDLLAGIAAIFLTAAMIWLGDTALALFAGILLAGGKLGSAVLPTFDLAFQALIERIFRVAVVVSRAPSIAALAIALVSLHQTGGSFAEIGLRAIVILCFLLWLWADLLLLGAGKVQLIDQSGRGPE